MTNELRRTLFLFQAFIYIKLAFASCIIEGTNKEVQTFLPAPPDYGCDSMWVTALNDSNDTGADVFYVVSTHEVDWKDAEGRTSHYADAYGELHRRHMAKEINGIAAYMGEGNNFYAPYYRHMTMEGWMTRNDDTISRRVQPAMDDVKRAFDNFLARRDDSRPIVIAGFSQGGKAVVELLKHMDDYTYSHLAAAYVMGFKVTPEDTVASTHIKAATGESDTGVTICYNTVKDVKYINPVVANTCMAINPVNWRTDSAVAILHDTINIALDTEHHVLVATNYSASEYRPYKGFINVGDIHGCEPWLYSECLQKNIAVRTREWRRTHTNK